MTLAALADLAEVIGAFGVIASLLFVGVQLRQNTKQMQRGEANSAMAQGSAIRHLIIGDPDVAALITAGVRGGSLKLEDQLRLNAFFSEVTFLAMQVWDRARNGLVPKDEFERTILANLRLFLGSPRGVAWWANGKNAYWPAFVAALEAAIPELAAAPSGTAPQGPGSAVAPPADAG
ncbi:MAG: hypothetical protein A4S17_04105 [Proteobacteria bacterium HN_bin10]|nr:MAG: hypothetical protein A4S17_04105 [Proteobacteria bacterium HN_bin10]